MNKNCGATPGRSVVGLLLIKLLVAVGLARRVAGVDPELWFLGSYACDCYFARLHPDAQLDRPFGQVAHNYVNMLHELYVQIGDAGGEPAPDVSPLLGLSNPGYPHTWACA